MKKLIVLLFILCGCAKEGTVDQCTVLIDITEVETVLPEREIIKTFGELEHDQDGKIFSLGVITDVYHSRKGTVRIEADTDVLSDDLWRTNELVAYTRAVDSLSWDIEYFEQGYERSEILRSIVQALEEFDGNDGRLVVYSDLMEHSLFSVYDTEDQLLLNDIDALVETIESRYTIPEQLSGSIEVHHVPQLEDQYAFTRMVQLYERLFEKRGVMVSVENNQENRVE